MPDATPTTPHHTVCTTPSDLHTARMLPCIIATCMPRPSGSTAVLYCAEVLRPAPSVSPSRGPAPRSARSRPLQGKARQGRVSYRCIHTALTGVSAQLMLPSAPCIATCARQLYQWHCTLATEWPKTDAICFTAASGAACLPAGLVKHSHAATGSHAWPKPGPPRLLHRQVLPSRPQQQRPGGMTYASLLQHSLGATMISCLADLTRRNSRSFCSSRWQLKSGAMSERVAA